MLFVCDLARVELGDRLVVGGGHSTGTSAPVSRISDQRSELVPQENGDHEHERPLAQPSQVRGAVMGLEAPTGVGRSECGPTAQPRRRVVVGTGYLGVTLRALPVVFGCLDWLGDLSSVCAAVGDRAVDGRRDREPRPRQRGVLGRLNRHVSSSICPQETPCGSDRSW